MIRVIDDRKQFVSFGHGVWHTIWKQWGWIAELECGLRLDATGRSVRAYVPRGSRQCHACVLRRLDRERAEGEAQKEEG